MARNLITKREGADAPSRPIIVQNVASLPAGAEISLGSWDFDNAPAGLPVRYDGREWHAGTHENDVITGVLVNDCKVYKDEDDHKFVSGAIMLIGVVNADYTDDANGYREALEGSQIVVIGKSDA